MENLPSYIIIVFVLTATLCLFIFYRAANRSRMVVLILSAWLILQAVISKTGFYTNTASAPPPFALAILPPLS